MAMMAHGNHTNGVRLNTEFTEDDFAHFRRLLLERRREALHAIARMRAQLDDVQERARDDSGYSSDLADGASGVREQEELYIMIARQRKFTRHLERALTRIEAGTYGVCSVTGRLIPRERLEAVPHTTTSIEAKMRR